MKLEKINSLDTDKAKAELFKCCGCTNWVNQIMEYFPFDSVEKLKTDSDSIWFTCTEEDWKEAFSHHPKIGEKKIDDTKFSETKNWAEDEQSGVKQATSEVLTELIEANQEYESKYGFIFIVCATGKSAQQMLDLIKARMNNSISNELSIAAIEQNKITHLRIDKLLV